MPAVFNVNPAVIDVGAEQIVANVDEVRSDDIGWIYEEKYSFITPQY